MRNNALNCHIELTGAGEDSVASFPRKRETIFSAGTGAYMGPRFRGDDAADSNSGQILAARRKPIWEATPCTI